MNILWLTDNPMTVTGYATISWNICNKLAEAGHNVYVIGHNYVGQPIPPGMEIGEKDKVKFKFTVLGGSPKPYAQDLIMPYIKKYKIDIFGVLLDTFMLYPWILNMDFAPAKSIFYFPSDGGGGMPLGCENILKKVNCPVSMAKFGQRQVKKLYDIDVKCIPHAIDVNNYFPLSLEEKEKCKEQFGLKDKFVVGVVQRNQGRKMPDRLIKAFKLFSEDKPDAVLFMHTDPYDLAAPFDLIQLINRYKLNNRVIFSGMSFFNGFDYKKMNEVYNAMDIFAISTSGEGFGVPIIEASACGIPVIATNYTTSLELLKEDGECGLLVNLAGVEENEHPEFHTTEILDGTLVGSWNVDRGIMSIKDMAKKMEVLYKDKELRDKMGKVGVEKANKFYNWNTIGQEWVNLVEELVK